MDSDVDLEDLSGWPASRSGRPRPGLAARAIVTAWFFLACILSGAGCSSEEPGVERVILVTIDTLRFDHLGVYGYPRETSPFLDALAGEGVVFSRAHSTSSLTAVSHASLFTSLYPFEHGVLKNWMELEDDAFTMAKMFRSSGFQTAGFPSVRFLGGMRPGFETYKQDVRIQRRNWHKSAKHQEADQTIDRVIVWLHDERSRDRFFLWIHLFDVHQHLPEQYFQARYRALVDALAADESPRFMEWLVRHRRRSSPIYEDPRGMRADYGRYDAQIRFVDDQLERLFDHLDEMGYGGNTLWVITSDHGEGLGDHGYGGHSRHLYDEIVQVPAIFYLKGSKRFRGRVDSVVRHVDLLPTLADTIGYRLPNAEAIEGASLLPLLDDGDRAEQAEARTAYAQRGAPSKDRKTPGGQLSSLQTATAKYILRRDGNDEFYDLEKDPLELENAIGRDSEAEERLRSRIKEIITETMKSSPDRRRKTLQEVDPAIIEDLKALGYLDAD